MFCFKPTEANVDFDMIRFGQVLIMIHDLHTERELCPHGRRLSPSPQASSILNPDAAAVTESNEGK